MEALAIHTGLPAVHWEDNTICISIVEDKRLTPIVKHIDIPVYFLQGFFYNGLFIQKYDNSIVMSADICTKPYLGPIMSQSTKCMTGFILYPTSDT